MPGSIRKAARFHVLALAGASALALSACAPTLGAAPSMLAPAELSAARSFDAPAAAWPTAGWWTAYQDPQLTSLIEEGLADSPSLAAAAARVRQAEAALQQTNAARLPSLSADASVSSAQQSINAMGLPSSISSAFSSDWNEQGRVAASLNWQLDFFGRNRAASAAASARADAARAEEASARLQLSTAIATTYAELASLNAERNAAAEIVRLRDASAELVRQRVEAELENQGQLAQAQSELALARADLAGIGGQISRSRNALAALVGKGPDRGLDIAMPNVAQLTPAGLPQDLSLDLIGRRPDIVAARARAESAARRIDVARADFYPNVNLTALIGLQSIGLDLLTSSGSRFGQIGPAISLPIFSGGQLEGAYRGARAEYDESVALYNQTLIEALREVADAYTDRRTLEAQLAESRSALASAEEAYRVARLRYEGGLSSYIDALTVENRLVAQRRSLATLESRAFALDVALVRALGGGFAASSI